jgi:hypothetical protein
VSTLQDLAEEKNIPIEEPFAGLQGCCGIITVVGPSLDYYRQLLPNFREFEQGDGFLSRAANASSAFISKVAESMHIETLHDNGETAAENNSSVILLLNFESSLYLLTGDAGIPALNHAIDYGQSIGIDFNKLNFFQVPHHGSRRNLGPTVLNRLIGQKGSMRNIIAYISAAKLGAPKHPAQKVINALIRRGAKPFATMGRDIAHGQNRPERQGWTTLTPLCFSETVDQ